MDPVRDPFAPGAGTPPPELAGRDELRATLRTALERARIGRPAKGAMLVGLRYSILYSVLALVIAETLNATSGIGRS